MVDLFEPQSVLVVGPSGRVAPVIAHPLFERLRYGLQTGELLVTLGEHWVDERPLCHYRIEYDAIGEPRFKRP
jgi:hypothetical protein